jgi:primosomal protein N' (replication factor Y)
LVPTPAHASLGSVLTYQSAQPLPAGTLVRVPLGKRETLGVVWDEPVDTAALEPDKLREIAGVLEGVAPLGRSWRQLLGFAASYYQRSTGEMALAALPPQLRDLSLAQIQRRLQRAQNTPPADAAALAHWPRLSPEQSTVVDDVAAQAGPFLLFGATGSPQCLGARPGRAGTSDGARDQPHAPTRSPGARALCAALW